MNNLKLFSQIIIIFFQYYVILQSNEGANLPQRPPAWSIWDIKIWYICIKCIGIV